jgi:hypothetical protein
VPPCADWASLAPPQHHESRKDLPVVQWAKKLWICTWPVRTHCIQPTTIHTETSKRSDWLMSECLQSPAGFNNDRACGRLSSVVFSSSSFSAAYDLSFTGTQHGIEVPPQKSYNTSRATLDIFYVPPNVDISRLPSSRRQRSPPPSSLVAIAFMLSICFIHSI